jgi:hypothetical protein
LTYFSDISPEISCKLCRAGFPQRMRGAVISFVKRKMSPFQ